MAEPEPPDVNVKIEKPGMSQWQQIAAYGVGTVALVFLLPLIWMSLTNSQTFIQNKLITTSEKSIEKMSENTAATKELVTKVDKLVDKQDELNDILKPLTSKLDKVANAVSEQTEQQAEEQ